MRKLIVAAALFLLILHPIAANASMPRHAQAPETASTNADRMRVYEEFVRTQMATEMTVGVTVGYVKDGVSWVRGYGYADLENKVPAGPDTAYRLASVSKSMTALAVVLLSERGKIDLDAEVQKYVPYFPKKPWPVTVRQVLGHLGGLSHYKNQENELHIKAHKTTREAVAIFENFDLVAEPGTKFSYSSYGYNLLGAVVEGASGMPFGDFMRENVWTPLGMKDTRMDDPVDIIPNRAHGYQVVDGKVANSEFVDISSRLGGGGIRSTVPDLLRYAEGIMAGKVVSPSSWKMITSSMATKSGQLTNYGMGWDTTPFSGRFAITHSGGQQETRTLVYVFPKERFALAVAMNFEGGDPGVYLERLFEAVTGEKVEETLYTGDRVSRTLYRGLYDTFNDGLAYYDRNSSTLGKSDAETAEGFAYFNRAADRAALTANLAEARKAIDNGRHPVAGQPFVKVGSAMAAALARKQGAAGMSAYPGRGAFAFFNDYIELYRRDSSIPRTMRFTPAFEQQVARWNTSWVRTNTKQNRDLVITAANIDEVGKRLRTEFAGADAYPEYYWQLNAVTRQGVIEKRMDTALAASKLAVDLYPDLSASNGLYGVTLVAAGRSGEAMPLLKKSLEINPDGMASPDELNSMAYNLVGAGNVDAGLALLKLGVELHPKVANLYDSIGDLYMKKGQNEQSLEWYRKALALDPNLKTSIDAVKKLTEAP